jgi:hypothetical protein
MPSLNLSPKSLASINKDKPTEIECAAAALRAAEEIARLNPDSPVYWQEREEARSAMFALLNR